MKETTTVTITTEQAKSVEEKKPIIIDKFALQKLLQSKPPEMQLKEVIVRCDRERGIWKILDGDKVIEADSGIITDVTFDSNPDEDVRVYLGCGSYGSGYAGVAHGKLLSLSEPLTVPEGGTRGVRFDEDKGEFFCKETWVTLSGCDYLILEPNCHGTYIGARITK